MVSYGPTKPDVSSSFYHIVDQGTTFHTAIHTKSHSTKDAIEALTKRWISWAGPRSGTQELNLARRLFHQYLQEHDVRFRMMAPGSTLAKR